MTPFMGRGAFAGMPVRGRRVIFPALSFRRFFFSRPEVVIAIKIILPCNGCGRTSRETTSLMAPNSSETSRRTEIYARRETPPPAVPRVVRGHDRPHSPRQPQQPFRRSRRVSWRRVVLAAVVVPVVFLLYQAWSRRRPADSISSTAPSPAAPTVSAEADSVERLMELSNRVRNVRSEVEQLVARGMGEQAIARLRQEQRTMPQNLELKELLADLYFDQKAYGEARKVAMELIEARPADLSARLRLARTLMEMGEFSEAYDAVRWYLKEVPGDAGAHKLAARICLRGGWPDHALRHLRATGEGRSDDVEARQLLALTYLQLGQYPRAIGQFSDLIRTAKADASNYYNLALAYARQRQASETLDVLTKAIEIYGPKTVAEGMGEPDFEPLRDDPAFRTFREQLIRQVPPDFVTLAPRPSGPGGTDIGWMPEPMMDALPTLQPR